MKKIHLILAVFLFMGIIFNACKKDKDEDKTPTPTGSNLVASFTISPNTGTTATIFNFDASSCTDAQDNVFVLQVRWDFNNDGVFETQYSTTKTTTHQYTTAGTYTIKLEVKDSGGLTANTTKTVIVNANSIDPNAVSNVTNPTTGKVWMDRNLGASRVATSSTDAAAYGDLYQWGRAADGHQLTSATTNTLSNSDTPGHGKFIITSDSYDWRSSQNDNLWQGVNGVNNPCPSGYRLPTEAEWNAERLSWSSNNETGAYASPLKLPVAGARDYSDGSFYFVGYTGCYWSSTVAGINSRYLVFYSNHTSSNNNGSRASGFSVRCIKD